MLKNPKKFYLIWDDGALTVAPWHPILEKILSFKEKSLEQDIEYDEEGNVAKRKGTKQVVRTNKPFLKIVRPDGSSCLQTMQGFKDRVISYFRENKIEYELFDARRPFPEPRLDLMTGFRFSQKELTTSFLLKRRSGLLVAPTRYGKSAVLKNLLRAYPGLPTVVTLPGVDLIKQMTKELREALPNREIKMIGGGSRVKFQSEDINVVSMDSLHKLDPDPIRLMLLDEPHAASSASRIDELGKFYYCRKYAVGATPAGRFDGRDRLLEGLVGPILAERTYMEAVEEKAICPIFVFWVDVPFSPFLSSYRNHAMNRVLYENKELARINAEICSSIIPEDWQTMIFINNEKQADCLYEPMKEAAPKVAMAKLLTAKDRAEVTAQLERNEIKRCLATHIYSQGVTFHDIRVIINAEGGGGNTRAIQKPGRAAEIRPGKKCGVLVDYNLVCRDPDYHRRNSRNSAWYGAVINCQNRLKAYQEKGYLIIPVSDLNQMKTMFDKLCL